MELGRTTGGCSATTRTKVTKMNQKRKMPPQQHGGEKKRILSSNIISNSFQISPNFKYTCYDSVSQIEKNASPKTPQTGMRKPADNETQALSMLKLVNNSAHQSVNKQLSVVKKPSLASRLIILRPNKPKPPLTSEHNKSSSKPPLPTEHKPSTSVVTSQELITSTAPENNIQNLNATHSLTGNRVITPQIILGKRCLLCNMHFLNSTFLVSHYKLVHSMILQLDTYRKLVQSFECTYCNEDFMTSTSMIFHTKYTHGGHLMKWKEKRKLICLKCMSVYFNSEEEFIDHVLKQHVILSENSTPLSHRIQNTSKLPHRIIESQNQINVLKNKVNMLQKLIDNISKKNSNNLQNQANLLLNNVSQNHVDMIQNVYQNKFNNVSNQVVISIDMSQNQIDVSDNQDKKSIVSGMSPNDDVIVINQNRTVETTTYVCVLCSQHFKSYLHCRVHIKSEHEEWMETHELENQSKKHLVICYQCPLCVFYSHCENLCKQHMLAHSCEALKPITLSILLCLACRQLFTSTQYFLEHQATCSSEHVSQNRGYSTSNSCVQVTRIVLLFELDAISDEKQIEIHTVKIKYFPCPICYVRYSSSEECKQHLKDMHATNNVIIPHIHNTLFCPNCYQFFISVDKCMIHTIMCDSKLNFTVKSINSQYECKRCDIQFPTEGKLLLHNLRIHETKLSLTFLINSKHRINRESFWESVSNSETLTSNRYSVWLNFDRFEKIVYICAYCSVELQQQDIHSHLSSIHSTLPEKYYKQFRPLFNCKNCGFFSSCVDECVAHKSMCQNGSQFISFATCVYICNVCKVDMTSLRGINLHIKLKHALIIGKQVLYRVLTLYQCSKCHLVVNLSSKMKLHEDACTGSVGVTNTDIFQDHEAQLLLNKLADIRDYRMYKFIFVIVSTMIPDELKEHNASEMQARAYVRHCNVTTIDHCINCRTIVFDIDKHLADREKKHRIIRRHGYSCKICTYKMLTLQEAEEHRRTCLSQGNKTYEDISVCVSCHFLFQDRQMYDLHMKDMHATNLTQIRTSSKVLYYCFQCDNVFQYLAHLELHMEECNPDALVQEDYLCQICNLNFPSQDFLKDHNVSAHNQVDVKSSICNKHHTNVKQYASKNLLRRGLKQLRRQICRHSKNLKQRRVKCREFYLCKICYSFCPLQSVLKHMKMHKEKVTHSKQQICMYTCMICDCCYYDMNMCVTHITKAHGLASQQEELVVSTVNVVYHCEICCKQFIKLLVFALHMTEHDIQVNVEYLRDIKVDIYSKIEFQAWQRTLLSSSDMQQQMRTELLNLDVYRKRIIQCSLNLVSRIQYKCPLCDSNLSNMRMYIHHLDIKHNCFRHLQTVCVAKEMFKCGLCDKMLDSMMSYEIHITKQGCVYSNYETKVVPLYYCSKCRFKFSTYQECRHHMIDCNITHRIFNCNVVRTSCYIYLCVICSKELRDCDSLLSHLLSHIKDKNNMHSTSDTATLGGDTEIQITEVMSLKDDSHTENLTYTTSEKIENNIAISENNSSATLLGTSKDDKSVETEQAVSCSATGIICQNNQNKLHLYCNLCDMQFKSYALIKEHAWEHSTMYQQPSFVMYCVKSRLTYTCKQCDKVELSLPECRRHVREEHHSNDETYIVTQVSRVYLSKEVEPRLFTRKPHLLEYLRMRGKPIIRNKSYERIKIDYFVCSVCNQQFLTQLCYNMHMLDSHRGVLKNETIKCSFRFKCTWCDKLCISTEILRSHLKLHKNKAASCKELRGIFMCSKCDMKFLSRNGVIVHLKNAHSLKSHFIRNYKLIAKYEVYKCISCPTLKQKPFFTYDSFASHMKSTHQLEESEVKQLNTEAHIFDDNLLHHEIDIKEESTVEDEVCEETTVTQKQEKLAVVKEAPPIEEGPTIILDSRSVVPGCFTKKQTLFNSKSLLAKQEMSLIGQEGSSKLQVQEGPIVLAPGPGGSCRVRMSSFQCLRCKSKFPSHKKCEQHIHSMHSCKQDIRTLIQQEWSVWFQCACKQHFKSLSLLSIHTRSCEKSILLSNTFLEEGEVPNYILNTMSDIQEIDEKPCNLLITETKNVDIDPLDVNCSVKKEVKPDKKLLMYPRVVLHRLDI